MVFTLGITLPNITFSKMVFNKFYPRVFTKQISSSQANLKTQHNILGMRPFTFEGNIHNKS